MKKKKQVNRNRQNNDGDVERGEGGNGLTGDEAGERRTRRRRCLAGGWKQGGGCTKAT
ncbi:MAG: hypothetical protein OCU12_08115 [Methanophagales archaeon]|nr:hypothetical protein [Methanophagales archaeon]